MPSLSRALSTAAIALVALSCSSGSSSSSSSNAPAATFSQIYPAIFPATTRAQCNFCHSLPPNERSNGKLSMGETRDAAYAALVGPKSVSAACGGKAYVVPGNPEESLFYTKVTTSPTCGDRMPLGGDPLSADQLEMIRSWIAAGAENN